MTSSWTFRQCLSSFFKSRHNGANRSGVDSAGRRCESVNGHAIGCPRSRSMSPPNLPPAIQSGSDLANFAFDRLAVEWQNSCGDAFQSAVVRVCRISASISRCRISMRSILAVAASISRMSCSIRMGRSAAGRRRAAMSFCRSP